MHTEVGRTKSAGINVTNVVNGSAECAITAFVSHEGYCAGCKDKVTQGHPRDQKVKGSEVGEDTCDRQRTQPQCQTHLTRPARCHFI